ncbi:MAG: serine hydrolase domain-containing protein [Solirubrobacterales bacterium]
MRAWALLFWSGALIGFLHTVVDLAGTDPPSALGYAGPLLLAASAIPILIGVAHRLSVARRGGDDRADSPELDSVRSLVGGRVRGAVAVFDEEGRSAEHAWGWSGTDRPLDPSTRFEIGSVTKTFTATLLAEMVVRGEVSLDDRVAEYVPGVPATRAGEELTLLDLATHSAGLPSAPGRVGAGDPAVPRPLSALRRRAARGGGAQDAAALGSRRGGQILQLRRRPSRTRARRRRGWGLRRAAR